MIRNFGATGLEIQPQGLNLGFGVGFGGGKKWARGIISLVDNQQSYTINNLGFDPKIVIATGSFLLKNNLNLRDGTVATSGTSVMYATIQDDYFSYKLRTIYKYDTEMPSTLYPVSSFVTVGTNQFILNTHAYPISGEIRWYAFE